MIAWQRVVPDLGPRSALEDVHQHVCEVKSQIGQIPGLNGEEGGLSAVHDRDVL